VLEDVRATASPNSLPGRPVAELLVLEPRLGEQLHPGQHAGEDDAVGLVRLLDEPGERAVDLLGVALERLVQRAGEVGVAVEREQLGESGPRSGSGWSPARQPEELARRSSGPCDQNLSHGLGLRHGHRGFVGEDIGDRAVDPAAVVALDEDVRVRPSSSSARRTFGDGRP
jgi:hypothetical protein